MNMVVIGWIIGSIVVCVRTGGCGVLISSRTGIRRCGVVIGVRTRVCPVCPLDVDSHSPSLRLLVPFLQQLIFNRGFSPLNRHWSRSVISDSIRGHRSIGWYRSIIGAIFDPLIMALLRAPAIVIIRWWVVESIIRTSDSRLGINVAWVERGVLGVGWLGLWLIGLVD